MSTGKTSSDHTLPLQLFEVAVLESEQAAVYFAIMLPQQRRALHFDRRIFELNRTSGHRELAPHRMIHRGYHAALLQMWVIEQLDGVEHGAAWHTRLAHEPHHLLLAALAGKILDDARQLFDMLHAVGVLLEARIVDQFGSSNHFAKRLPHFLM